MQTIKYKKRTDKIDALVCQRGEDSLLSSLPQNSPLDYFLPNGNTQLKLLAPNSNPLTYTNKKPKPKKWFRFSVAERRGFEP